MPPLVGCQQPSGHIAFGLIVLEVDARAPHQHHHFYLAMPPLLLQVDGEEVPLDIEVRFDPQVTFIECDEDYESHWDLGVAA
jgi:hypothetical protein